MSLLKREFDIVPMQNQDKKGGNVTSNNITVILQFNNSRTIPFTAAGIKVGIELGAFPAMATIVRNDRWCGKDALPTNTLETGTD